MVVLFLRRFDVNIAEFCDETPRSAYYYWKDPNLFVFVRMGIGTALSLWMYSTLAALRYTEEIFTIMGASIPSSLIAGLLHHIVARAYLLPGKISSPPIPKPAEVVSKSDWKNNKSHLL